MSEGVFIYCDVTFGDLRTYSYRTTSRRIKVGTRVIVPVYDSGRWAIGVVVGIGKFSGLVTPYPLEETKRIISKAGWRGLRKVRNHNDMILHDKRRAFDISRIRFETEDGYLYVVTTASERRMLKKKLNKREYLPVENFLPATRWEVAMRPPHLADLRQIDVMAKAVADEEEKIDENSP